MYQVLGGRLIDRVDDKGSIISHSFLQYYFIRTLITGHLIEAVAGGSTAFEHHDQTKAHAVIHCINRVD